MFLKSVGIVLQAGMILCRTGVGNLTCTCTTGTTGWWYAVGCLLFLSGTKSIYKYQRMETAWTQRDM